MGSARIAVRVKPGSKQPGIALEGTTVVVRVRERAIEGAANDACVRALAERLGIARSAVRLTHGAQSRQKLFEVEGLTADAVYARLRE